MSSTRFESEGSSSGRRLYTQLCVLQASVLVVQVKRTITTTVYKTVLLKMNPRVRNM